MTEVAGVPDIAIVLTCRADSLGRLSQARASVDAQLPTAGEAVAVFDGCLPPTALGREWTALCGVWGHRSHACNRGLEATSAPWVILLDAEEVMPAGYLAAAADAIRKAPDDVGIVYPDMATADGGVVRAPEWDYWGLRAEPYIRSAAAWRRQAVELVGGWSTRVASLENYALALDVTARGWKAMPLLGPPIVTRRSSARGSDEEACRSASRHSLWRARSLGIVSLLAGRESTFGTWESFLRAAELPSNTSLYVVDNSGRPDFSRKLYAAAERIATERGFTHLDVAVRGSPYASSPDESYLARGRNLQVTSLYGSVLPRVREDLILTLEDDIEPPRTAVRELGEQIGCTSWGRYGAVSGAWDRYEGSRNVIGGRDDGGWGSAITWEELPSSPIDVGCVGGACTMWANWVVSQLPVNFWWDLEVGWDGCLCMQMRALGYGVRIHGGVRCMHHTHGSIRPGAPPGNSPRRS